MEAVLMFVSVAFCFVTNWGCPSTLHLLYNRLSLSFPCVVLPLSLIVTILQPLFLFSVFSLFFQLSLLQQQGLQQWFTETPGLTRVLSDQKQRKSHMEVVQLSSYLANIFLRSFPLMFYTPAFVKSLPSCMTLIGALFLKLGPLVALLKCLRTFNWP